MRTRPHSTPKWLFRVASLHMQYREKVSTRARLNKLSKLTLKTHRQFIDTHFPKPRRKDFWNKNAYVRAQDHREKMIRRYRLTVNITRIAHDPATNQCHP